MRNSSCNRLYRELFATTVLSVLIILAHAGLSSFAEEGAAKTVRNAQAHPEPHEAENPEPLPADKQSPEIVALYEKYGGYCDAIVDAAREQRYALKRNEIDMLSKELQKQIDLAEEKSTALEKWVNRREDFAKQATAKIVEIYANMRPEASAARLQQLDINLAASLLLAIPPRQASPILNEMDEKNAAAITAVMAASARMDDPS